MLHTIQNLLLLRRQISIKVGMARRQVTLLVWHHSHKSLPGEACRDLGHDESGRGSQMPTLR